MQIDFIDSSETVKAREPFLRFLRDMEHETEGKMRQRGLSNRELSALHREHLMKIQPVIDELVRIETRSVRHIMSALIARDLIICKCLNSATAAERRWVRKT